MEVETAYLVLCLELSDSFLSVIWYLFPPTLIITEDFGVCAFKLFARPEVILYAVDTALKPRRQP